MAVKPVPAFIDRVRKALVKDLGRAGIGAEVTVTAIPGTKLHRVRVEAGKFARLRYLERQAVVWKIVDSVLSKDEQLFISMIETLTPSEASGESAA